MTKEYGLCKGTADASLDRWHRKTLLTTGKLAGGKGSKLQALDQSISKQVEGAMRNPERLIRRARLPRTACRPIGQAAATSADADVEDEGDAETYDDAEFYHQLLQEFLEHASVEKLGIALHRAQRAKRKRKTVDRRASKGRKIRYTVMDPLVNFMAPEAVEASPMVDRLLCELFGTQT